MHLDGIKRDVWFGFNFLYVINVIVLIIGHHVFRIFIESDDKSLNWLNNKLRFGGGSRFVELPVFTLLFLLFGTNELKF